MSQKSSLLDTISSAVFFFIGVYFVYSAQTSPERNLHHAVFWDVGCALSSFAIALQPKKLFENIKLGSKGLGLPTSSGWAGMLNLLSAGLMVFAVIAFGIYVAGI
ncbi:MAG: hypothetical protein CFE43_21005 [Burkholderiales bacterium PBB3]|nr:MAG: hypothetical protein CFE43_21005 [Burkholderiales bacterium PBB3]